jgi:hypothetical protein
LDLESEGPTLSSVAVAGEMGAEMRAQITGIVAGAIDQR